MKLAQEPARPSARQRIRTTGPAALGTSECLPMGVPHGMGQRQALQKLRIGLQDL